MIRGEQKENNHMVTSLNFEPYFATALPETHALLKAANLTLHPSVSRVTLHGSRGLAGGCRSDSDVDLSLIVDRPQTPDVTDPLREVLETTFRHWQADVELDLAVIFDLRNCELACFEQMRWKEQFCQVGGTDCFGLFKTQRGYKGLVTHAGIQVKLMYPCLKIWQRR